jgi:hypothetical protein
VYIPYNAPPIGPNANLQADRPDPLLSSISRLENFGRAWYHALQTKLERRFASGVAFTFSYSFSRSMTLGDNGVDEGTTILPYSPAWYNRGRAPFDYRHLEYATLLWDLPFGRGRKFHTDAGRLLDAVAGGWSLTFTQTARSGGPLSISGGYPNLGEGDGTRADIVGNPGIANPSPAAWFNTAAFVKPPLYAFGNSAQGILDGPGLLQFNTTLSKTFRVAERKRLQFRWDAFNTFNRVNYQGPSTNVASSLFGRVTGANTARYMQLGVKFLF